MIEVLHVATCHRIHWGLKHDLMTCGMSPHIGTFPTAGHCTNIFWVSHKKEVSQ